MNDNKKPTAFEPTKDTIWLLEDRQGLESTAARFLGAAHPGKVSAARIVNRLDTTRLGASKTLVVVFIDPTAPTKPGSSVPNLLESEPIACSDLYLEGEDGFGAVQIKNLINENTGRVIPGLCERISRACMRPDEFGKLRPTVRAIYRDDDKTIRVSGD